MNKKIYQAFILLISLVFTHESIADDKITLTKELIESLDNDPTKNSGLINGEKYIVSLQNGDVLIVAKVNANNSYEPIALAKLGYLPYPEGLIKNNAIIVHGWQVNHGTYDIKYEFRLKNNAFYLSSLTTESNYSEPYNDPDIQIAERTNIFFDKSIVHHWKKLFNLNKKSERIAWDNSMKRLGTNLTMLGGVSKTVKFRRKAHALNNFNFDTDISNLTHHSSGTPCGAP